jgi:hypothetical protein
VLDELDDVAVDDAVAEVAAAALLLDTLLLEDELPHAATAKSAAMAHKPATARAVHLFTIHPHFLCAAPAARARE